ncbi:hypothetical protein ABZX12_41810 [Kribbella sp. NPDC003505]|uniref:hypothetical protein n=1 Tax=Kribbella sp. NPDC003505 TaxID=3154448 RepID=UPI0033A40DB7
MPKLTDDELGDLLRETFADHEHLADYLPEVAEPPRHRGPLPVLLAAAAVLAILVGALYGVSRVGAVDSAPPAATPAPTRTAYDDSLIWSASLETLLRSVKPNPGAWQSVILLDGAEVGTARARKGPPISADQREMITSSLRKIAPLRFGGDMQPAPPTCRDNRVGVVEIADVVDKGDHVEAWVSLNHDCNHWKAATYRVEHRGPSWVVTATVSSTSASW